MIKSFRNPSLPGFAALGHVPKAADGRVLDVMARSRLRAVLDMVDAIETLNDLEAMGLVLRTWAGGGTRYGAEVVKGWWLSFRWDAARGDALEVDLEWKGS